MPELVNYSPLHSSAFAAFRPCWQAIFFDTQQQSGVGMIAQGQGGGEEKNSGPPEYWCGGPLYEEDLLLVARVFAQQVTEGYQEGASGIAFVHVLARLYGVDAADGT